MKMTITIKDYKLKLERVKGELVAWADATMVVSLGDDTRSIPLNSMKVDASPFVDAFAGMEKEFECGFAERLPVKEAVPDVV